MDLIDTHCHIYLEEFQEDIDQVIVRSKAEGISKLYLPNIDSQTIFQMKNVAGKYPEYCFPMMGLHPCSVKDNFEIELRIIRDKLDEGGYNGIGEIGTDLYWDQKYWDQQKQAFKIQIEWAKNENLPIIIHCRESLDLTLDIVEENKTSDLNGVFHCFSGTIDQAKRIEELGFYMGIGGVSTFKNGGLDKVLPFINLNNIVLETDSPYLAPAPFRGKRNEPSYIKLIANRISEIYGIPVEEVAQRTTFNAQNLFGG